VVTFSFLPREASEVTVADRVRERVANRTG
jgi:hypothetical protein